VSAIVHVRESAAELAGLLEKARPRLAQIIPSTMSVERIIGVIQNEFARNPRLRECDPPSVVRAVVHAAELGLDPSPRLGQVWFIPRRVNVRGKWIMRCEAQVGYKGWLKKTWDCARILSVSSVLVHERDEFRIQRGTTPVVHHVAAYANHGEVIGAYFTARLTPHEGNVWLVDEMSVAEILGIRDRSDGWRAFQAGRIKSTPWKSDEGEMMRKTMLVRGLKHAPIDDAFRAALEGDADDMRMARAESEEGPSRVAEMKARLVAPGVVVAGDDAEVEEEEEEESGA